MFAYRRCFGAALIKPGGNYFRFVETQWFFKTGTVSSTVLSACSDLVEKQRLRPSSSLHNLAQYLKAPEDWCLSRQLWWGHRIPAFRVNTKQPLSALPPCGPHHCQEKGELWVIASSAREASAITEKLGIPAGSYTLEQDEDVLDTWFSSGLVPFIITKGKSISLMETGKDILFFWVCRMSWLYESLQHSFPFDAITLHSMVVDPSGKKMSKSRGNVIDPMDIINGQTLPNLIEAITARKELSPKEKSVSVASMKRLFPKGIRNYGSDVLRLALLRYRLILCCKF